LIEAVPLPDLDSMSWLALRLLARQHTPRSLIPELFLEMRNGRWRECRRPGTSTTVAANVRACGAALHRMQRKAAATACAHETGTPVPRPHVPMRPCILQVWVHITYTYYAACELLKATGRLSSTVNLEAARIYYL
jgi:hypothetical protein